MIYISEMAELTAIFFYVIKTVKGGHIIFLS